MSAPSSFTVLFNETYRFTKKRWAPIVIGSILFGVIDILCAKFLPHEDKVTHITVWPDVPRVVILAALVVLIVTAFMQMAYFWLLALGKKHMTGALLRESFFLIWEIVKGEIWYFLVSWIWLLILLFCVIAVGIAFADNRNVLLIVLLVALLFIPLVVRIINRTIRYSFMMLLVVKEGKGARTAARLSYKQTNGYVGKIIGYQFLFALMILLVVIGLMAGLGLGAFLALKVNVIAGSLVLLLFGFLFLAYIALVKGAAFIFRVRLYETIVAHPRK